MSADAKLDQLKASTATHPGAPVDMSSWEWILSPAADVRALMYDYLPVAGVRVVTPEGDVLVAWDKAKRIVRYCPAA